MKSEFKKAGTLQLTGMRRIDRRTLVCERRGSLCSGRWIFVEVDVDIVHDFFSLITFY